MEAKARGRWSACWPVLALAALAVLVSLVVHHWVFPAYSWNRDEPVYLWQVHALRDGQLLPTDGGMPSFFQPWLAGHGDGFFFSQYTLGWPIVLLVGEVVFGTAAAALAIGAMLAVLGTYAFARTITGDRTTSLAAAAIMLASPIVVVQSGVYLGYLFTLGLGLLFGAALITGFEQRRPWLLVAAGGCVGWIFMTRPYDAVLWAVSLGGYLLVLHRHDWRRLLRGAGLAVLGALPLVIATLAYNRHVTGSFTEFPITAADPLDTFGFGLRRLMPALGKEDYTPVVAIRSTARNGLFLPFFLFGSYLGVVAAGFGVWFRRRERTSLALVLLMLAFPLGYFVFWGMHVSATTANISGPIYFIPLYAPLAIFIATALVRWWHERRRVGVIATVVLVLVTVPVAANRIIVNHRISASQEPWRDSVAAVHGRATVFVQQGGSYLLLLNPFSANNADLDGRILYAIDQGAANFAVIDRAPHRALYLQQTSIPPTLDTPNEDPSTPEVTLQRLRLLDAPTATVHVRVTNPSDDPVVVVTLTAGDVVERRLLATSSKKGASYDVDWQVAAPGAGAAQPGTITLPAATAELTVAAGFGASEAAIRHPSLRRVVSFRAADSSAEWLLPSRGARLGVLLDAPAWIERASLPALQMTVRASTP